MQPNRPKQSPAPVLVWFRLDLRLRDHPALAAAARRGNPVIPVFIWEPEDEGSWAPGAASRWWLHQSLHALGTALADRGSRLILRRGPTLAALHTLAVETGATAVFWTRRYEPDLAARDVRVKQALRESGIDAESLPGSLLHEPWSIANQSGRPFQVFTPYWRHCLAQPDPEPPIAAPKSFRAPKTWPESLPLAAFALEPRLDWAKGFRSHWTPGAEGARHNLERFLADGFGDYEDGRNRPDRRGTSRLSPHLHFGEITPRVIWHAVATHAKQLGLEPRRWRQSQYLAELGWREFAYHLLHHFPQTPTEPLRPEFARFPWRENADGLKAWQRGRTGYPLVDAGMRELWATGWMHNRVRMVVASFLVKDLLVAWQEGARWFWDTLVDADLASNTLGWQWTAGCGADAAPYFRVFNPTNQSEKFDPAGAYIRKWVPEVGRLPDAWIHRPWEAPTPVLAQAGVDLGKTYPRPIVSHAIAREVALEAYRRMKNPRSGDSALPGS